MSDVVAIQSRNRLGYERSRGRVEQLELRRLLAGLVNTGTADDQIWNLAATADEVEIHAISTSDFVITSRNGAFDATPFTFAGSGNTVAINLGDGADVAILTDLRGTNVDGKLTINGEVGDDTIIYSTNVSSGLTITDSSLTETGFSSTLSSFERAVLTAPTVTSGTFSGQVIVASGVPNWVAQGPGPLTGGQVTGIPNQPVTGSIEEVAVHPFDLSSMYVGTVGGGVWRNSDISVLFDTDQSTLTADAQARLNVFADFLTANPALAVSIVGHTDDTGDQVTVNQPLSVARALEVKNFLVNAGIDAGRLADSGQGELQPVDSNTTVTGREHNRRVELTVNHWVPLTDHFPSLSTSTLAISPLDADGIPVTEATPTSKLVIYAGTGTVSSAGSLFAALGNPSAIGILKSTDGGATWKILDDLAGGTITAIQVFDNGDLLVSTNAANASKTGLFRSTDGGDTFLDVAVQTIGFLVDGINNDGDAQTDEADEAFPAAAVSDVVLDPGNSMRAYVAVPRQGVFITNDRGVSWNPVNTGITTIANAKRIMLAVSPSTNTANRRVYAATIGNVQPLSATSNAGALTLTVSASTVIEAGDTIQLAGAELDGLDNDAANGIDDVGEAPLRERWVVATVGAIVGGNRVITLTAANADGIDNDRNGAVDDATETASANQGLFRQWGPGATVTSLEGSRHRLSGLFRSDDLGANWTAVALPGTVESGSFVGIHSGAQGDTHFSIAVDPLDKTIVYVGGDRQPSTSTSIGSTDFTGRLFRGNANTGVWEAITDNGANNTAPHADSREMTFRGMHVVEVDDGGIYQLRNAASPGEAWESLNADLSLTEFYSLAYDPVSHVILGGTQDIGNALQSSQDSTTWNTLAKGDGTVVGFSGTKAIYSNPQLDGFTIDRAGILNAPAANTSVLILPGSTNVQNNDIVSIGGFLHNVQNVIANPGLPAGSLQVTLASSMPNAHVAGEIAEISPPLTVAGGVTNAQFVTPFVINRINPFSILIGTHTVYESTTLGRTLTALGTTTGSGANILGEVHSLIYGGRETGVSKPNVIWVGTDPGTTPATAPADFHPLWLRQANSAVNGALSPVTSFTTEVGVAVKDIAVDPDDWRNVFVLDAAGDVWFSPNAGQSAVFAGDNGPNTVFWNKLTDNLGSLPGTKLLEQIAVKNDGGTFVLLAGGQGGVFRRIGSGHWQLFGSGLPNALVTSLEIVDGTDDLLLAGTFGRGAWSVPEASLELSVPSKLELRGSASNDVFVLQRDAATPWMLDVFQFLDTDAMPAQPSFSVPYLSLTSINIDGGSGADRFVIDAAAGAVAAFPNAITIVGGGGPGNDELVLKAPTDPNALSFDSGIVGTVAAGSNVSVITDVFGETLSQNVTWSGMELVNDTELLVPPTAEVVASGLNVLANAFTDFLTQAMDGVKIPGLDAASLTGALNGLIVENLRPKELPFVPSSAVPGSDQVQIDNGLSVLLRIFQGGRPESRGHWLLCDSRRRRARTCVGESRWESAQQQRIARQYDGSAMGCGFGRRFAVYRKRRGCSSGRCS